MDVDLVDRLDQYLQPLQLSTFEPESIGPQVRPAIVRPADQVLDGGCLASRGGLFVFIVDDPQFLSLGVGEVEEVCQDERGLAEGGLGFSTSQGSAFAFSLTPGDRGVIDCSCLEESLRAPDQVLHALEGHVGKTDLGSRLLDVNERRVEVVDPSSDGVVVLCLKHPHDRASHEGAHPTCQDYIARLDRPGLDSTDSHLDKEIGLGGWPAASTSAWAMAISSWSALSSRFSLRNRSIA